MLGIQKIRMKNDVYQESLWSPRKKCHDLGKNLQSSVFHNSNKKEHNKEHKWERISFELLKNNLNYFRNTVKVNLRTIASEHCDASHTMI